MSSEIAPIRILVGTPRLAHREYALTNFCLLTEAKG